MRSEDEITQVLDLVSMEMICIFIGTVNTQIVMDSIPAENGNAELVAVGARSL